MNRKLFDLETKTFTINNSEMCYVETGQGQPVILLHGLGGSKADWSEVIFELADTYKVYALDLPGFGESPPPPKNLNVDYTYYSKILKNFLAYQDFENIHLVGNSLGGGVSLRFSIDNPKIVRSITLASASGIGREVNLEIRLFSLRWLVKRRLANVSKEEVRATWRSLIYDQTIPIEDRVDITWKWVKKPEIQAFMLRTYPRAANLFGQRNLMTKELANIQAPTLITWGDMDNVLPVEHAAIAYKRLPYSSVMIYKDTGHLVHIEKSKEFSELLFEHLDRNQIT